MEVTKDKGFVEEADKIFRAKAAADYLSIGLSTLYRWAHEGRIPKPLHIGPRVSVWKKSDLDKFVQSAERR